MFYSRLDDLLDIFRASLSRNINIEVQVIILLAEIVGEAKNLSQSTIHKIADTFTNFLLKGPLVATYRTIIRVLVKVIKLIQRSVSRHTLITILDTLTENLTVINL
jgi:hypothetical protein